MSHITLAQQGIAAVDDRRWDEAITKLSKALRESQNPNWLIARSKALVAEKRFEESLEDANLAWHSAFSRNKRDAMAEAHYRRAVAYFRLKQYANADACCMYSMRIIKGKPVTEKEDPKIQFVDSNGFWTQTSEDAKAESQAEEGTSKDEGGLAAAMGGKSKISTEWRKANVMRMQTLGAMERLPEDDPARKVSATYKPPQNKLADLATGKDQKEKKQELSPEKSSPPSAPVAAPAKPTDTPMRLQDFQNDTTMTVSIFSKGNKKDGLKVSFAPKSVTLDPVIHPSGEAKAFQLDLWGEIDPETSTYTVTPNKLELSLKKKSPGKWSQLKGDNVAATGDTAGTRKAEEEREW